MFAKYFESINAYFTIRETKSMLSGLSDAALADIGLTRAGIAEIGAGRAPLRRRPVTTASPFYTAAIAWTAAQPA